MAQAGFTPIVTYHSTTGSAVPTAANLLPGELGLNINDMKLYCENSSGVVTLLASAAGSSGNVVGPASATDTAVALFDGTTGKLLKNSAVTVGTTGNTVISGTDNSNAMLRITQLGTGNALVVEDSANPDSTPFVIDAIGKVIVGNTAFITPVTGIAPQIQVQGNTASTSSITAARFSADSGSSNYLFSKSRNTTVGTYGGIVSSGDILGNISFVADDGANPILSAQIQAAVDGTPGTNDMPGRLVFATTADGASTVTERMRITNAGNALIGGTAVRGTTVGSAHLDIFNGTAPAGTLTNGISLYSASGDFNFMDSAGDGYKVGFRNIPAGADKTSSYALTTADVGKVVGVGTGGSITIPDATFAAGDAVIIFNNTTGSITITCTITTAYIAGADTDKATLTLATRGIASILFVSGTVCVVSGNVT
jgi:hypothetical protein